MLQRMKDAGLRLKLPKCSFMTDSVEYLGHHISAEGIRPTKEKVRGIVDAPEPHNVSELRSFLGLVNYYGKFLPQLSTLLAPLNELLRKEKKWKWGVEQAKAFQAAKTQLASPCLLVHFNPDMEIVLACEASPYGVGAVLSHRLPDGTEKPIALITGDLIPGSLGHTLLSSLSSNLFDAQSSIRTLLVIRNLRRRCCNKKTRHVT